MARRDFDREETISPPTKAIVLYKDKDTGIKSSVEYYYTPTSVTESRYVTISYTDPTTLEIRTSDYVRQRETLTKSILAAVNPTAVQSRLENGLAPFGEAEAFAKTITITEYGIGIDGPIAIRETVDEYVSRLTFAGQLGIQNYAPGGEQVQLGSDLILASRTIIEYQINEAEDITKTLTTRYLAWGTTAEGRDLAAIFSQAAETADELNELITSMEDIRCDGTTIRTVTGRGLGLQERPSEQAEERSRLERNRPTNRPAWIISESNGSGTARILNVNQEDVDFDFGLPEDDGFVLSDFNEPDRIDIGDWDLPTTDPPIDPEFGDPWLDANTDTPTIWDGDAWTPVLPEPPEDPEEGDTWIQSGTGESFMWRNGEWRPYTPRPEGYPVEAAGAVYYNAHTSTQFVWNGTSWVPYADTAPLSPDPGDRYVEAATGIEREWSGTAWAATGAVWPRYTTLPPANPAVGDQWIDRNTNTPKRWDGARWEPFTPARPASAAPGDEWVDPATGVAYVWSGADWVAYSTTAPSSPAAGQRYVNPTTGVEFEWSGTAWAATGVVYGSTRASNVQSSGAETLRYSVIELPFPNDDTVAVEDLGGGVVRRWLVPGGVKQQATDLAVLENAMRYGTAYGANIVVEPWLLPSEPMAPFTIRAGGIEAQFLVDGPSWEFDGELFVASCDGILCGATARITGERLIPWVTGQVDLRGLPAAATPLTNPGALPANTIPAPAGFDPARPRGIWNLLPTNGTDTFEQYGTPTNVFLPFSVRDNDVVTTRPLAIEIEVEWSLLPIDEGTEDVVTITTLGDADDGLMTLVWLPASVLNLGVAEPLVYVPGEVSLPVTTLSLTAPVPTVSQAGGAVTLPLTTLSLATPVPDVSGSVVTVELPLTTLALTAPVPTVASVAAGEGTLQAGIFLFPAAPLYLFEPD